MRVKSRLWILVRSRNTAEQMYKRACAEKDSWLAPLYCQRMVSLNNKLIREWNNENSY